MTKKILTFTLLILTILFSSCKKDIASKETQKVNQFIKNCFQDVYLWNSNLPNISVKDEPDSYALFNKLKYKDDRWSTLTDNVKEFNNNIAGEGLSYGYGLSFYYKSKDSKEIIAVVRFVYSNTPAELNGLKRGDIILQINGENLNENNYLKLYNSSQIIIGMGEFINDEIYLSNHTIQMTASKIYLDPVITYSIIEKNGHKIGYLHYKDYQLKSHSKLSEIFTHFKNNSVTDIVLDLRYNNGGYAITSQYLCSMLVPEFTLNNKQVYLKEIWNDHYMTYYKNNTKYFVKTYSYEDEEGKYHTDQVTVNMDLSNIYILTGKNTASASEATIVALMPYMNVITIGENTSGKYCGGIVLSPENYKMKEKEIQNWGAYVMVYRYANNEGYPNHTDGLVPSIHLEEDLLRNPFPLGDQSEPLLARAISEITGVSISEISSSRRNIKQKYSPATNLEFISSIGMVDIEFNPSH